jgi:hypothetical protein
VCAGDVCDDIAASGSPEQRLADRGMGCSSSGRRGMVLGCRGVRREGGVRSARGLASTEAQVVGAGVDTAATAGVEWWVVGQARRPGCSPKPLGPAPELILQLPQRCLWALRCEGGQLAKVQLLSAIALTADASSSLH